MERKEYLTNENLRKKFNSQFDLVNYAISLAENMILSGRDSRVQLDTQNRATQLLAEIYEGKDKFEEIIIKEKVVVPEVKKEPERRESPKQHTSSEKLSERKKARKILSH